MRHGLAILGFVTVLTTFSNQSMVASADNDKEGQKRSRHIQVGPRLYYLVADMDLGLLKTALQQCSEKPLKKTNFSIGHRGAALQFPEYTQDSYEAAARMGAGIVECDVTFMKDKELVYRHSQYAANAHAAGLDIITWTVERSGLLTDGGGFYYQTVSPVIRKLGDMMKALDVLAQDVRILGIFSDWPAAVTYYANCLGLE